MPNDAPRAKVDATRGYGATVEFFDRQNDRPDLLLAAVSSERGLHPVPAFDDALIMAGQGTAALELIEEAGPLDILVAPLGGGGLLSGSATAACALSPGISVIGVETEAANDWVQSLERGERVIIDAPDTIADGIRTRQPGTLPWEVVRALGVTVQTVSEDEVKAALRVLVTRLKLVVEPTGAVAPALALSGRIPHAAGKRIGVIISGGNVDPDTLAAILTEDAGEPDH